MRGGPGNHTAPENTQPEPEDNTARYVQGQIEECKRTQVPVHPEVAREIAAWFASPGRAGYPFAAFASTGTVIDGFIEAIKSEDAAYADPEDEAHDFLAALLAYAEAARWCEWQTEFGTGPHIVTCGRRGEPGMQWCAGHAEEARQNYPTR